MTKHSRTVFHLWDELEIKCQLGDELRSEFGNNLIAPLWIQLKANMVLLLCDELVKHKSMQGVM